MTVPHFASVTVVSLVTYQKAFVEVFLKCKEIVIYSLFVILLTGSFLARKEPIFYAGVRYIFLLWDINGCTGLEDISHHATSSLGRGDPHFHQ